MVRNPRRPHRPTPEKVKTLRDNPETQQALAELTTEMTERQREMRARKREERHRKRERRK